MKLYRFDYSCYARKIQMLLDLLGEEYELIDVPYSDRTELIEATGGYMQVPVLVDGNGAVIKDSRVICRTLLIGEAEQRFTPAPWQGPIWAYSDWCDHQLEDVMFRIASPKIRDRFADKKESALFVYIKERRFGEGCVNQWEKELGSWMSRAKVVLKGTLQTLSEQPFVFGEQPTLADVSLYGHVMMVHVADSDLLMQLAPELNLWRERLESYATK